MVKKMCNAAGIEGKFTNYSLRASSVTALFQSEAPKRLFKNLPATDQLKLSNNTRKCNSHHAFYFFPTTHLILPLCQPFHHILYKMKIWHRTYFGGLANYENPPN